ncbi:Crp/Fnr family transcriptional regulator [Chryseobacterium lactis]|uniref:Crp/Fnr family transcriptional regulator n=1 Tax=Chryseobacterium lactis TaxID=1241981 RepID=A0A3G6RFJ6_CHRLC|nr:Crp/Fnr family transcriptional regulator [Chryseobacterium lactis]AZA83161.1 Crp/Fnr family transcriptional regulator [Chryseobacterium lactis]AZB03545.1 Crp/Fnr family transcriptional regulator [Chryseobacterium lactis]PNW11949.1 Crp/Fnr family transcriptional regulator [Chryseobacterium lactis]
MELSAYLEKEGGLPKEIITLLDEIFDYQELPKNHILLANGSRSKQVFFIEEGLLRIFYYKDGKDITDYFFKEDIFFLSVESVFLNQEYHYSYELLENCKIRVANYSKIEALLDAFPKLNAFVIMVMAYHIKILSDRVCDLQFQSAQNRYRDLITYSPDLVLRAPLGYIASYLGITQQTLSVIRATTKF